MGLIAKVVARPLPLRFWATIVLAGLDPAIHAEAPQTLVQHWRVRSKSL
jgi:hypothetical protein